MPGTGFQKFLFGTMMSLVMVYGMEVYNASLRNGALLNSSFMIPLDEMIFLTVIVFVIQTLLGGPLARKLAFSLPVRELKNPSVITFTVSVFTVLCMCPAVSLVVTLLFKGIDGDLFLKWFRTTVSNLPMAFCWQIFVAGPLVRFLHGRIFQKFLL